MTPFKKLTALVLLTILVTALTTYYFLQPTPQGNITQARQAVKTIKQKEQGIDKSYTLALQKLQKENDSLKKLVDVHKAALKAADEKVSVLEKKMSQLADKVNSEPDTAKGKVYALDSLGSNTTAFIQQENERDSLCNATVDELSAQVSGKDSVIDVCHESYNAIKLALDTSLTQQQQLTDELNSLNKHIKRQVFKNRFLSVSVLLLSGIAATFYLEQRHP